MDREVNTPMDRTRVRRALRETCAAKAGSGHVLLPGSTWRDDGVSARSPVADSAFTSIGGPFHFRGRRLIAAIRGAEVGHRANARFGCLQV